MAALSIGITRRHVRRVALVVVALLLSTAVQATVGRPAVAAHAEVTGLSGDLVMWTTPENTSFIYVGRADGTGSPTIVNTTGATTAWPWGLGVDAAAGRLYWANNTDTKISYARLDGSGGGDLDTTGATVTNPIGVVVDHAGGRIYWANNGGTTISYARLDGSGGGNLNTTGATVNAPFGVAIDAAGGRIYWANYGNGTISYARLDGTGGGNLNITGSVASQPTGVVIDTRRRRVFWGNFGMNAIGYANLDGSGGGVLATPGATQSHPQLGSIDPETGRLYWTNWDAPNGVYSAKDDGSGGGATVHPLSGGAVAMPVLFKQPDGLGAPVLGGGHDIGQPLTCSAGSWGGDLPGELTYRAPAGLAYQWLRNGSAVAGATASSYVPQSTGTYSCAVTATNAAGSTTQTSGGRQVWAHRPDAFLRGPGIPAYVGDGVYDAHASGQTVLASTRRGHVVVFDIAIQNDTARSDTFKVRGRGAMTGFAVHYLAGLRGHHNVTNAVTHGRYTLRRLGAGQATYLRLVVSVQKGAKVGTLGRWKVRTWATADSTADAVQARVKVTR